MESIFIIIAVMCIIYLTFVLGEFRSYIKSKIVCERIIHLIRDELKTEDKLIFDQALKRAINKQLGEKNEQ